MNITLNIPQNCSPAVIDHFVNQLPTEYTEQMNLDNQPLGSLNFTQIALLISLFRSAKSSKKQQIISFLKKAVLFFNNHEMVAHSLELENLLYTTYLKHCESEQDYNMFFSAISDCYPHRQKRHLLEGPNLAFFVQTPRLLAHVNPLVTMIEEDKGRTINPEQIFIISLGHSDDFESKFNSLGVKTIDLKISDKAVLPLALAQTCKENEIGNLVWQCLPTILSYARSHIDGISWWSMKFHPNISGLKNYITNADSKGLLEFNGREWTKFTPAYSLKNEQQKPRAWNERRQSFAAFCREELIDCKDYWLLVAEIINEFDMEFHYTGRRAIHQKFVKEFNIPKNKVKFLGWLDKPEKQMGSYNFILDGGLRGHGVMASEAIATGVPIIFPESYIGSDHSRIKKIYAEARVHFEETPDPEYYTARYYDAASLKNTIRHNCRSLETNTKLADFQQMLMSFRTTDSMKKFSNIIFGK